MFRNLFSAMAAVCFFYACPAQDLHYINYSASEGLPSSQVHDIYQDRWGRLWFTTDQGLSCFDGYSFKNYTTADGMTDDVVFKFHPTPDGKVWCTTFNRSVFYFTGKDPVFTPYRYNHSLKSLSDVYISNNLCVTADGSLFMGFVNVKGYMHIDSGGQVVRNSAIPNQNPIRRCLAIMSDNSSFYFNQNEQDLIEKGPWKKIFFSEKAQTRSNLSRAFYFSSSETAVYTSNEGIEIHNENSRPINIPCAFQPISLGKFTDTSFWVGFRYGGLTVYNFKGECLFTTLKGKSVTSLLVDHEGGYWCSTLHDGVFHAPHTKVYSCNTGNEENWINGLCKDGNNKLWVAYYNGNVDCIAQGAIKNIYTATTDFPSTLERYEKTREVMFVSDEKIFIPRKGKTKNLMATPMGMYVLSYDTTIICGYGGLYVYLGPERKTVPMKKKINDITRYHQQWYVVANDGLHNIKKDTSLQKVLDAKRLVDMENWNGSILMASRESGIVIWNGQRDFRIDASQGLCTNAVLGIYAENDSVVWAYTNKGVDRIVIRNNRVLGIRNFSKADGLVSNEVTAVEVVNDTIWIGTRQGLCFFPYSNLHGAKDQAVANYLDLEGIKINDRPRALSPSLELGYRESRIEFLFGAVSFSESQRPVYRYKLVGLETRWKYTQARSALYASLPAGSYTFEVQAKTAGAGWGKTARLAFAISPPFWRTWWFMISVTLVLAVLIYLFFRFRILSYNRDITRELLRQLLKRLKRKTNHVVFREQGKDIRIPTDTICYVKADGNYIEIHTDTKKYVIRHKIGEFIDIVPDPLEYLRVSRSFIVRLDKVQEKSKKDLTVKGEKIAVGETYLDQLQKIKF